MSLYGRSTAPLFRSSCEHGRKSGGSNDGLKMGDKRAGSVFPMDVPRVFRNVGTFA
jgi:hypothetical protein